MSLQRLVLHACVLLCVLPLDAEAQAPTLASTFEVQLGDYVAVLIPEFLRLNPVVQEPVLVTYEPDEGVLDVEIFGRAGSAEAARRAIEGMGQYVTEWVNPYLERRFGLALTGNDYRFLYYNSGGDELQLILQWSKGQFVMP